MKKFNINKAFAEQFAADWITSWNAHDIEGILSHYADDFEMNSPKIINIAGVPSGVLYGKNQIGAYWKKALALYPDLRFELISVLAGVESVTLYYKGAGSQHVAEVFHFNSDNRVDRACAHYAL